MNLSEVVAALKDKRITPAEARSAIAAQKLTAAQPADAVAKLSSRTSARTPPAATAPARTQLTNELIASLADALYLDRAMIDAGIPFSELGLDSILGVEWIRALERQYGVAIASTTLYAHPTIHSLVEFLLGERGLKKDPALPLEETVAVADRQSATQLSMSDPPLSAPDLDRRAGVEKELRASLAAALYTNEENLSSSLSFSDLGLDSIIGIEWVRTLNRQYETTITATKLYEFPTLSALAGYLVQQAPGIREPGPLVSPLQVEPSFASSVPLASAIDCASPVLTAVAPPPCDDVIAIIGGAGRFPGARNLDVFWDNLASGKDCITEISPDRWSMDQYFSVDAGEPGKSYSKWLGAVEDADKFDPQFFNISPAEAEQIDPQQRLFIEACWHCLEDAGVKPSYLSGSRCAVFVGCAVNDYGVSSDAKTLTAEALMGNSLSILSARIAYFLNLKGPCLAIETSCSSSLVAIAQACDSLMSGQSDLALAGGVSVLAGPRMHIMTSQAGMLSRSGRCFSFDERADGFVPGEGVGVVLLKRLSDAIRDGDCISAIVRGVGINQDGRTNGITAPSAGSQAALVQSVYERAQIPPDSISLLEAHGTATRLGDPIEVEALTKAFRHFTQRQKYCALGSVKSNIGHLLAAAGIAGVMKVILAMRHRKLPPTIHFERLNPLIALEGTPFYINASLEPWESPPGVPRRAGISSFGFSGTNAHVLLEEYVAGEPSRPQTPPSPAIILLSARSKDQLRTLAADLLRFIAEGSLRNEDLARVAYTSQVGRQEMDCRLALTANCLDEVAARLRLYLAGQSAGEDVFTGVVERGNEIMSALDGDEGIQKAAAGWLESGQHAKLAALWVRGLRVNWELLHPGTKPQRVRLPLYPFARERYWGSAQDQVPPATGRGSLLPESPRIAPSNISKPMMFEEYLEHRDAGRPASSVVDRVLCIVGSPSTQDAITRACREHAPDTEVVFLREDTRFHRHSRGHYSVEKNQVHSVARAFAAVREECGPVDTILYLPPFEDATRLQDPGAFLQLLQALSLSQIGCTRICVVAACHDVVDRCYAESWIGFERSLQVGMPGLTIRIIGIDQPASDSFDEFSAATSLWAKIVVAEFAAAEAGSVLYENGSRYHYRLRSMQLQPGNPLLRRGGTYLIVGGGGGLGALVGDYLARHYQANLVLTGRSPASKATWQQIEKLKSQGAEAIYLQADVCDTRRMREVVVEARRHFGSMAGVVHAAGTLDRRMFLEKDARAVQAVFASKIDGVKCLDDVLADLDSLDFICYFSSSSAVFGDPGWCDYAVSNRFMAAYAKYVPAPLKAKRIAIHWPLWRDGGIQFESDQSRDLYLEASGQRLLETEEGLTVFERLLGSTECSVLVMAGSEERIEKAFGKFHWKASNSEREAKKVDRAAHLKGLALAECVAWDVKGLTSKLLRIAREQLDNKRNLVEFGFDSISLGRFAKSLSEYYAIDVTPAVFFSHATLDALTGYLMADHSSAMTAFYGEAHNQQQATANGVSAKDQGGIADTTLSPGAGGPQANLLAVQEPIAIIGMSGRFPQARSVHELWEILEQGRDVIEEIPRERFDWRQYYGDPQKDAATTNCKWMGSIPGVAEFDALFFDMSPLEGQSVDPRQRLLLQEAWNALEDAAYGPLQLEKQRIGVFVGAERGDYESLTGQDASITANHDGILATRLSYFLNLHGPAMAINTACSSGLVAAHQACLSLRAGECDVAVAAAVNVLLTPAGFLAMGRAGMLSSDGKCHAFGERANGMVPAEAVVAVVLKPLSRAQADGDPIHAVIRGSGINYDGKTNGITAPSGSSQANLLCDVYDRLRLHPREIEYIVAHGTGTKIGDPIEINALCEAFRKYTSDQAFCALSSTKSNLGHSFAASGLVSMVSLVLAMNHETIPASLHCEVESDHVRWDKSPFFVNKSNRSWPAVSNIGRLGAVSSFGMSGTNAHLVLQSHEQQAPAALKNLPPGFLLVLSAKTEEALVERAQSLLREIRKEKRSAGWLYAVSYTLLCGRHHFDHRSALVVTDVENASFLCSQIGAKELLPNLFRGKVVADFRPGAAMSRYAEDLVIGVENCLQEPEKYQESLYALADLFCQGYQPSWARLFQRVPSRRISLPGYSFAKEQLWTANAPANIDRDAQTAAPGPLAWQDPSSSAELVRTMRFTRQFTGQESFLTDHSVQGLRVLPAVMYLEIVREAVEQKESPGATEYLSFENVVFSQPLVVERACTVFISLTPDDFGACKYSVYTRPQSNDGEPADDLRITHSQGVVTRLPKEPLTNGANLSHAPMVRSRSISPEFCYKSFREIGLHYGPAHRGLTELVAGVDADGRNVAHARVTIPDGIAGVQDYVLHPGLLDATLQASIGLTQAGAHAGAGPRTLLPFAIDRVELLHQCSTTARVVLIQRSVTDSMYTFDADLFDDRDRICVRFRGFHTRPLPVVTASAGPQQAVESSRAELPAAPSDSLPEEELSDFAASVDAAALEQAAIRYLTTVLAQTLKVPAQRLDESAAFEKYGIDSLSVIRLTTELEKFFGTLPKTLFFEYENIRGLAAFFCNHYARQVATLPGMAVRATPGSATRLDTKNALREPVDAVSHRSPHPPSSTEGRLTDSRAVAIVGVAGRYPKANNLDEFWLNLRSQRDCITEIPVERWDHSNYFDADKGKTGKSYSKWGGFIDDVDRFDPLFFNISPREAELMDPQERLFLECVYATLEDAGYTRETLGRDRGLGVTGNVGVFVGVMYEEYQLFGAQAQVTGESLALFGSPASIANRVSYFCNFHGPSMAVDTMCSSSLTAIHLACESLLSGACEAAIAGGVNVSIHPNKYLTLSQGQFASSIGRCESFGIGGDGYVPGEGVGAVLLKPLQKAVADRDLIYGVIEASALNHGGKTNGYSVPSPNAQANVIRQALRQLRAPARAISYIETHGTGTSLGDPIEIAGLSKAFAETTIEKQFCAIGSVKSNIGHCESAAGIAGLTKVLLQMRHGTIVPSLHSQTLNPHIDFESSPFIVQRRLAPWERPVLTVDGEARMFPRIAGLSSFGAGGSNAHLILSEHATTNTGEAESIDTQLLPVIVPLSARTEEQLKQRFRQLERWILDKHVRDQDLLDLAYTLQVGREAMEYRAAFLVNSIAALVEALRHFLEGSRGDEHIYLGNVSSARIPLNLLASDEDAQKTVAAWMEKRKYDKLLELWVSGGQIDWDQLYRGVLPRRMSLPTYPFARDRYWAPVHKPGIRTSGDAGPGKLHPLLHANTSDLFTQRYTSTFSGQEAFFTDHVVSGLRILPGAAYVEIALAAVLRAANKAGDGAAAVREVELQEFEFLRPLVAKEKAFAVHTSLLMLEEGVIHFTVHTEDPASGERVHCKGRAVLQSQARGMARRNLSIPPAQWSQELSGEDCYARFRAAGLEYGPTHQLLRSVHMGPVGEGDLLALAVYRLPESLLAELGHYLLHPSILDAALQSTIGAFPGGYSRQTFVPVRLDGVQVYSSPPGTGYVQVARVAGKSEQTGAPLEVDIDICSEDGAVCVRLTGVHLQALEGGLAKGKASTLLLTPAWEREPLQSVGNSPQPRRDHCVWFCQSPDQNADRLAGVLSILTKKHADIRITMLALPTTLEIAARATSQAVEIFELIQRTLRDKLQQESLVQVIVPGEDNAILFTTLAPLLKTAHLENPRFLPQIFTFAGHESAESLVKRLMLEREQSADTEIRYHRDERWVLRWKQIAEGSPLKPWKDGGSYLITGGAGGLGLLFAGEICRQAREAKVMLTGRSALSEEKLQAIKHLRGLGGRIEYRQLDVSDHESVARVIEEMQALFGGLQGIIHSAGITRDNFLVKKTLQDFKAVMAPKCAGVVNLDEVTKDMPLEFFAMFSSLTGVMGNVGQGDYAGANAFMDGFATHRSALVAAGQRKGRSIALDWPLWQDGGMRIEPQLVEQMRLSTGLLPLPTSEAMTAFYRAMNCEAPQVIVLHQESGRGLPYPGAEASKPAANIPLHVVAVQTDLDAAAVVYVKNALAKILKLTLDQIEADAPFERYGIDSVLMMQMTSMMEKDFGPLPKTLFFEYQSLASLAGYLLKNHRHQLALQVQSNDAAAPPPAAPGPSPALPKRSLPSRFKASVAAQPAQSATWQNIAIIGLSGKYPEAEDLDAFWENLKNGRDCVTEIPADRWDHTLYFDAEKGKPGKSYSKWGGFIKDIDMFDPLFFNISPREAKLIDPQERLMLQCAYEALEDAGYTRESVAVEPGPPMGRSVGVFVGVMYEEYQLFGAQSHASGTPFALSGSPSSIANRISYFCNLHGPSLAVDTMCSSSLTAIHLACQSLHQGECSVALAGGVNLSLHPNKYIGLAQALFVSSRGRCESFGEGGEGYVPAEGVGVVVLKPLANAIADGDHIYGVLKATAVNHGGKNNGYSVPSPVAQGNVISQALHKSGLSARGISYVEAHGTGTKLGDPIEIAGLGKAFSALTGDKQFCAIGSVKSNIGHGESAAGIAGLTKILLQMKHRQLVPSLHAETLNPNIDFAESQFFVQRELTEWKRPVVKINSVDHEYPRIAGLSSFGAGGSNAHLIVEEYEAPERSENGHALRPAVFVLSAKSPGQRTEQAARLLRAIHRQSFLDTDLVDIAYTLQVGREAMEYRMALTASSIDELKRKLQGFVAGQESEEVMLGDTRQSREYISMFAGDDELAEAVSLWLQRGKHRKLMEVWTKGVEVDWPALYRDLSPRRISLPTYAFAKERYWIEKAPWMQVRTPSTDEPPNPSLEDPLRSADSTEDRVQRFVTKQWQPAGMQSGAQSGWRIVVVTTEQTHGLALQVADRFPGSLVLQSETADSFVSQIALEDFTCWVDVTGCGSERAQSLQSIAALQKWMARDSKRDLIALCATRRLESLHNDAINLSGALLAGLFRVLQSEYSYLRSRHMDSDLAIDSPDLVEQIIAELVDTGEEPEVCYRAGERYRAILDDGPKLPSMKAIVRTFPNDQVLWITGGSRGLGYLCAQHFARHYGVKRFVLMGREVLPPTDEWQLHRGFDNSIGKKIRSIEGLQAEGAEIRYSSVSLSDVDSLREEFAAVELAWGPPGGLIHCAGTMDSENPAFLHKTLSCIQTVLAPKVAGLDNLLRCLGQRRPQFVVLFSSVSAAVPTLGVGQADYAMANAYLDYTAAAYAHQLPILSLQWPSWSQSGFGEVRGKIYRSSGLLGHSDEEGLNLLDRLLSVGRPLIGIPAVVDPAVWKTARLMARSLHDEPTARLVSGKLPPNTEDSGPVDATHQWLMSLVCDCLGMRPGSVDIGTPLYEYGVDSVMFAQLSRDLAKAIGEPLDPSVFFEHSDLRSFTRWLLSTHGGKVAQLLHPPIRLTSSPVPVKVDEPAKRREHVEKSQAGTASPATSLNIAVVGMTCRFPGAPDLQRYWQLLAEGRSAIGPIPRDRWGTSTNYFAGLIDSPYQFDPGFFLIPAATAAVMDTQALLVLEESLKLFCHAGYSLETVKGTSTGVYLGARSYDRGTADLFRGLRDPVMAAGQNYLAANVSRFFDFHGPSLVIDSACSSALVAMNLAIQALQSGDVQGAVVGGVSMLHDEGALQIFKQRGILSPASEFHLFDGRAQGAVLGEGAGLVLLKTVEQAKTDGDTIYAVINSIAVNNDGRTAGAGAPNTRAQRDVMQQALRRSGFAPEEIGYIDVNGSGSEITDLLELRAIEAVYRSASKAPCMLGSMKPNIGHPLTAEGIASFIRVVLMLHHQQFVPFLSAQVPMKHYDLQSSPLQFPRELSPWVASAKIAAINCFADGGTNVHALLSATGPAQLGSTLRKPVELPALARFDVRTAALSTTRSAKADAADSRDAGKTIPSATGPKKIHSFWNRLPSVSEEVVATNNSSH